MVAAHDSALAEIDVICNECMSLLCQYHDQLGID